MKLLTKFGAIATVGASALFTGCATEYKVVEVINKDGSIERRVTEKSFMDKVNDVGNNNTGTLGLINTAANVGTAVGTIGTWTTQIGRNKAIENAGRNVSGAINNNTKATQEQTNVLGTFIQAGLQGICK